MINSAIYKVPEEQFIDAVNGSKSIRQILLKLGFSDGFANYNKIFERCKWLGIEPPSKSKYNIERADDIHKLKAKILKENLIEYKCAKCNRSVWQGKQLSLHLHHIDGDHYNNDLSNLKFLCPNCHSQEPIHRKRAK